jgi:hypothetical protein
MGGDHARRHVRPLIAYLICHNRKAPLLTGDAARCSRWDIVDMLPQVISSWAKGAHKHIRSRRVPHAPQRTRTVPTWDASRVS